MLAILALVTTLLGPQPADSVKDGHELLAAMHHRYQGSWYKSLSFVQRVVWADGRPEGEWWEAMRIPGQLRIDMTPVDSGNGVIYRGDSLYRFSQKAVQASKGTNPLLILGFDVYGQPPQATAKALGEQGFDLSQLRTDSWQGRPAYVVGGPDHQFWVDRERLLFVRLISKTPSGAVSEIQFNRYQPLGDGWIAPEVVFMTNGKETMREIYRDMKANPALDPSIFEPRPWRRPAWIPKP